MTHAMPPIAPPAPIQVTEPETYMLDNGIEVFGFNGAVNEILKVDLIFDAGRWAETHPLTSSVCSGLIKSGTASVNALEMETQIDFLGSTIKASAGYNNFSVSVYCMTVHLEKCLIILQDILHKTVFPEKEIELDKVKRNARLRVNERKNDYVGDMVFKEALFGNEHPYGYTTTSSAIDNISQDQLIEYYRSALTPVNCMIGISGNYKPKEIDLLNKYLGDASDWQDKNSVPVTKTWTTAPSDLRKIERELKDSVQASLFVGTHSIERLHPDFKALSFTNLIYGGYFGSRLMKNIREDKGLTYGIYSYIQNYKHASAFIVNTETAVENVDQCLHEIYAEMDRLREEAVGDQEILIARNYVLGRMLDQVDGPFKSASTFMGLKSHDIPLSFIKDIELAVRGFTAEDLQATADKYLQKGNMYEIVIK